MIKSRGNFCLDRKSRFLIRSPKITLAADEKGKNVKISSMAELYISFLEDGSAHGLIVFLQLQAVGRHNAHGFFFTICGNL